MKLHPWWLNLPEARVMARRVLALAILPGLLLWLVVSGLLLRAALGGEAGMAQAGATAATLLAGVVLCLAAPWLVLLAWAAYLAHRLRKGLPQWMGSWQRRALRLRTAAQSITYHTARPIIVGYGLAATFRALLRFPHRVWLGLREGAKSARTMHPERRGFRQVPGREDIP